MKLVDTSVRKGMLVTVDPQTGAAALFIQVRGHALFVLTFPENGAEISCGHLPCSCLHAQPQEIAWKASDWKLCILFPDSIESYEIADVGSITLAQLEGEHPLLKDEVGIGEGSSCAPFFRNASECG